ncbi:MAG: secondary thiamine-phosphate synthase enzyme YjbQ [Gammaproteobacteria bacterium]
MTTHQFAFSITTPGRGMVNVTDSLAKYVKQANITTGLCNVFLHHTSASLIICENTDSDVQRDLEVFFSRLVPDGDKSFKHIAEGPDDMSSHVRTILTLNSISIPISQTRLNLGTWQGVFVWEHRLDSHQRNMTVTIQG